jgi:acyl-CoA thioester hydrolase
MEFRKQAGNGPYNISAETEFTVEFYDVDPMRIVWHGNYIKYFELARRTLLDKIGYGYQEMEASGYAFPVIDISVKYVGVLKFKDRACVKAVLEEYENRLRLRYEIRNVETGALTTKGISTQMAYDVKAGESCFVCPEALSRKVEAMIEAGAAR